jgi:syntaxin-binding protein 1
MRFLMIYVLFKEGIWDQDLQYLLQHTSLSGGGYDLPLRNLDLLHPLRIYSSFEEAKNAKKQQHKRHKPANADEETYELSRYVPPVKTTLEELVQGNLDPQTWTFTSDQPPEAQPTGHQGSLRTYILPFSVIDIDNAHNGSTEVKASYPNNANE